MASEGNAIEFGNLLVPKGYSGGLSSSTRGIIASDYSGSPATAKNVIEYVQMNTLGSALDCGDLTQVRLTASSTFASPTRGVMGGGWVPGNRSEIIDYITIASTGDAVDFGDLTVKRSACAGGSNATRGVFMGGYFNVSPVLQHYNTIDYITIATTGNATNFGDRTFAGAYAGGATSQTRMIAGLGFTPTLTNIIDFIEIATAGNAQDFGDASITGNAPGACSDSHGGLGGF